MSDTPFVLHGGGTEQAAIMNRINAISRIQHLSGVDLRTKSKYFLFALDLEMYQRWYKDYPKNHVVDEEWIQRAVEVVKSMDKDTANYDKATELAGVVRQAYTEHEALPLKLANQMLSEHSTIYNPKETIVKKSFWQKIKERIES